MTTQEVTQKLMMPVVMAILEVHFVFVASLTFSHASDAVFFALSRVSEALSEKLLAASAPKTLEFERG